jgi:signal transduction histidine kinase
VTVSLGLHRARILDLLNESEVEGLAVLGEERNLDRGEGVFRDHEAADSLYIVLEGRIQTALREKGQRIELATHNPGEHFARVALIEGQLCYTSATAVIQAKVFVLSSMGCAALLVRMARGRPLVPNITPMPSKRNPAVIDVDPSAAPPSSQGQAHIRSLSSAVAGVAHEINTPLGVIANAASFVAEQLASANLQALAVMPEAAEMLGDVGEACRLIQKNVTHAARLVQSFKKLSVGQLAEPRQQVDLVRVIHEVLNIFRAKTLSALPPGPNYRGPRGQSGQHRLILASSRLDIAVLCELPENLRIWDGFPGLFSRVLLNLLTNIDRYAYPGDEPGRVEITLTRKDNQPAGPGFHLKVRDFGRGIALTDLPHIFDPFFTTGRDRGGTGLGLSMVHNLVTQGFNGSVRATSVVDEGTTFELEFPERAPDHAPDVVPEHGASSPPAL